jgi:hypothetical protein
LFTSEGKAEEMRLEEEEEEAMRNSRRGISGNFLRIQGM